MRIHEQSETKKRHHTCRPSAPLASERAEYSDPGRGVGAEGDECRWRFLVSIVRGSHWQSEESRRSGTGKSLKNDPTSVSRKRQRSLARLDASYASRAYPEAKPTNEAAKERHTTTPFWPRWMNAGCSIRCALVLTAHCSAFAAATIRPRDRGGRVPVRSSGRALGGFPKVEAEVGIEQCRDLKAPAGARRSREDWTPAYCHPYHSRPSPRFPCGVDCPGHLRDCVRTRVEWELRARSKLLVLRSPHRSDGPGGACSLDPRPFNWSREALMYCIRPLRDACLGWTPAGFFGAAPGRAGWVRRFGRSPQSASTVDWAPASGSDLGFISSCVFPNPIYSGSLT